VTTAWVEACLSRQTLDIQEAEFELHDAQAEEQFGFSLAACLQSAHQSKVFSGLKFYITPGVDTMERHLSVKQLQTIIACAGGGSVQMPPKGPTEHTVVISCSKDNATYTALAVCGVVSHSAEFVMMGVLRQVVDRESFVLHPAATAANTTVAGATNGDGNDPQEGADSLDHRGVGEVTPTTPTRPMRSRGNNNNNSHSILSQKQQTPSPSAKSKRGRGR
jgi:hypothetical protein